MVSSLPMQSYYQAAPLSVDTSHAQQKYFEEEDSGVLDDNILEQGALDSGIDLSPPMADSRRESFAMGPPLFSPKTESWSVEMQSVPSNNPFESPSSNHFMRADQNQPHSFGPTGSWAVNGNSFQRFDGLPPTEYDANTSIFHTSMHAQTPFSNQGNMFASLSSGSQSIPTSPHKEWMAANQAMGKKMRAGSPSLRAHSDMRRGGDGIRKKNARFEIPAERNLGNIDNLIAQSTDDQEIKELKQQKRLLRNRQAALDSRQRKKMHTERLEDEKKQYTTLINELEDELDTAKAKIDQLLREKQSYMDFVETLSLEKEEMIRTHTLETGELRKKVGVLTEHARQLDSHAVSGSVPAPGLFAGAYGDMDDMAMAGWDNAGFLHSYPVEPEVSNEMAVVPKKNDGHASTSAPVPAPAPADGEKGASQGGLLFMLFLVGAFVMSSRSTPSIPQVSEDFRAASATILESVLKDAGIASQATAMGPAAPLPSGSSGWANPTADIAMGNMGADGVTPSMLGELGDSLTRPTQEQTNEQIFSLSAAQYNGANSQDFLQNVPERSTSQGRRNLAEALAAMRSTNKQNGAAEVYTRSLLWNQIPSEVVRNFAKMVAECNNAQSEQQCNGPR